MNLFGNSNNKKETTYMKSCPKNSNGYHCTTCKKCVESGNGSFSCKFGKPILIIKNTITTNEYFWCNGKGYESK